MWPGIWILPCLPRGQCSDPLEPRYHHHSNLLPSRHLSCLALLGCSQSAVSREHTADFPEQ